MTAEFRCAECGGWHDIPERPERGNVVACIAALRAALDAATARAERAEQYHGGHLPTCTGMDTANQTCGCGYLDGAAYRDLLARAERAEQDMAATNKRVDEEVEDYKARLSNAYYERDAALARAEAAEARLRHTQGVVQSRDKTLAAARAEAAALRAAIVEYAEAFVVVDGPRFNAAIDALLRIAGERP